MIDDEGFAYAKGHISFPPDPTGTFVVSESELLRIGQRNGELGIVGARAHRDRVTEYLVSDMTGPAVRLPHEIALMVRSALRRRRRESPLRFAVDLLGEMSTNLDPFQKSVSHGLSDWQGTVTAKDGGSQVEISAALTASTLAESYVKWEERWPAEEGVFPRLRVTYFVDEMTSVVGFGSYNHSLAVKRENTYDRFVPTSLDDMRLSTTPMGVDGSIFAVGQDQRLFRFQGTAGNTSVSGDGNGYRFGSGLFAADGGFPSIFFRGIDLAIVQRNMLNSSTFSLVMTGESVGSVQWQASRHAGRGDGVDSLYEARYDFELTLDGLNFSYFALTRAAWEEERARLAFPSAIQKSEAARVHGSLTIPWEALILEAPQLLRHKQALLAELDSTKKFPAIRSWLASRRV